MQLQRQLPPPQPKNKRFDRQGTALEELVVGEEVAVAAAWGARSGLLVRSLRVGLSHR